MLPRESRRMRRKGRAGRRPDLTSLECLEGRELMAYTPLGFSLPDLSVSGFAAPTASWGGPMAVTVDVSNTGASTIVEPLAQQPGSTSTADSPATTVAVFASRYPNSLRGQIYVGSIAVPALEQNSIQQITSTLTLPSQPAGFPRQGGSIYLHYVVNPNHAFAEMSYANNGSGHTPVVISPRLPQLQAVALDVPPTMQPGDTISPTIQVANLGSADTDLQGPVTVYLVASTTKKFGPGSSIVASYTVSNIPSIAGVPSQTVSNGSANINTPSNIVTISGSPVTLPNSPATYYLGVVIDPDNKIQQIGSGGRIGRFKTGSKQFSLIQSVGPPIAGLPPAGVVTPGGSANNNPFPFPAAATIVGYGNLSGE